MLEDSLTPRYQVPTQSDLFQSKIVRLSDLCRFVLTCAERLVLSVAEVVEPLAQPLVEKQAEVA
ncbi:MAG: hypothetical protein RMZ69_28855 [Nostoc sp. ChiQUE01a]|nr:hypothetical protein [Nostoc sp. ChiQUE01a]